eukprot:1772005-Rhodomonas_salina.4
MALPKGLFPTTLGLASGCLAFLSPKVLAFPPSNPSSICIATELPLRFCDDRTHVHGAPSSTCSVVPEPARAPVSER